MKPTQTLNSLSANPINCSNTPKQFVNNFATNFLSAFDHFGDFMPKGLNF